jgi:hypothetical protein
VQPILAAIEAIAAHWDGGSEEGPDNRWGSAGIDLGLFGREKHRPKMCPENKSALKE